MSQIDANIREEFEHFFEALSSARLTQMGFPVGPYTYLLVHLPVPDTLRSDFEPLARAIDSAYPNALSEGCIFKHALTTVLQLRGNYKQPNQSDIDAEFEAMIERIECEIEDYTVIVPIENLKLDVPELRIADVAIVLRRDPPDSRLVGFTSLFESNSEEYRQDFEYVHSFAIVTLKAQGEKAKAIAIDKVKDILNVLRLFIGSGNIQGMQLFREVRLIGETGVSSGRYVHLVYQDDDVVDAISEIVPRSRGVTTAVIGEEFIDLLRTNGLPYIEAVLQGKDKDDFRRKIYRAITWFGRGICANTDDEKFVSYVVALETLLIGREGGKRARLAKRVAFLLSDNPQEREQLQRDIKALYDLRSAIVHGGKPAERVAELETLTRRVIHEFVLRGFGTFDEFLEWIERAQSEKI
jgi:hypothetical protein